MYLIALSYFLSRGQDYSSGLSSATSPPPWLAHLGLSPITPGWVLSLPWQPGQALCLNVYPYCYPPFCSGLFLTSSLL